MSEAVKVALIVSIGPSLTIIVTHLLASKKLDHITVLTNSTLSAANERIAALEKRIADMLRQVDE